ncbi:MAG: hypothetical protein ACTSR3_19040, partial [Candidatus Helarchaeota archaeon]
MLGFIKRIWELLSRVIFNKSISTEPNMRRAIYNGNHFFSFLPFSCTAGSSKEVMISVPDREDVFAFFNLSSNAEGHFSIFEGVSVSASGTSYNVHTSNRNASNSSPISMYEDPTVSGYGTGLLSLPIGAARWKATEGGAEVNKDEYILKKNTDYVLQ